MPNQVLCCADPDSRTKRDRTGAGIRHNQSDIGNVMSFRPAKVSATVNFHYDGVPHGIKEPVVIAIFGIGPVDIRLADPHLPAWRQV
jgi:hypothetical protein